MENSFDGTYKDYWKERVNKLSDGTKIADADIADLFLPYLEIDQSDVLLDMGCSYGRFFPLLSKYTKHVIGVDIEADAVQKAAEYAYERLEAASLENMPFKSGSIDRTFCWATFDCTEQEKVLSETSRILKPGGTFLVTGKNIRYMEDDEVAFIAERNAKLKSFPNHFTDVMKLYSEAENWGFKIERGFAFQYRGDFGLAKAIPMDKTNAGDPFYEYLLILRKTGTDKGQNIAICDEFSATARKKSALEGFSYVLDFFKSDKEKNNI